MWEASQHLPNIYHKNLIVLQSDVLGRPRAHVRRPRGRPRDVQRTSKECPRDVQGTFNNTKNTNTNDSNSNSKSTKGTGKGCFARAPSRLPLPSWMTCVAITTRSSWTSKGPFAVQGRFSNAHVCNTAYFFALSRHTDKLPRLEPRIQNLQDSKSPGLKTEGFKHSRIQGFTHSGTQ